LVGRSKKGELTAPNSTKVQKKATRRNFDGRE